MNVVGELWPYLILILAGFLPNEVWRMLGIVASSGVDEGSELIIWVRAVATAILTGVVAKIIVFAPGALADVSLSVEKNVPNASSAVKPNATYAVAIPMRMACSAAMFAARPTRTCKLRR